MCIPAIGCSRNAFGLAYARDADRECIDFLVYFTDSVFRRKQETRNE